MISTVIVQLEEFNWNGVMSVVLQKKAGGHEESMLIGLRIMTNYHGILRL